MRSPPTRPIVALIAGITITGSGHAAVRICSDSLVSMPGKGATELVAKKAALDDWLAKAKAAGFPAAIWPIAAEKQLSCEKTGDGLECIATGRACAIEQKAPEGFVPAPRVKP